MDNNNYILPFIDYVKNSHLNIHKYHLASESLDNRIGKNFIDVDNDFSIGNSGGFLMNMNFKFVDTHLFSEIAKTYERNTNNKAYVSWVESLDIKKTENRNRYYYCSHLKGTKEYDEFWSRETYRRRNGLTKKCKLLSTGEIVDLHITGDHYNYLNYSRILRTPIEEEQKELHLKGDFKTTMIESFPRFWDGDYWNFKIDLFISNNNYHLCKGKARGKGYSYKRGSQAANTVNIIPKSTVILAAYDLKYLTDPQATSDMVKINLDWFENNTHWKRFYLSEVVDKIELGYKTQSGGNKKYGFRSKVLSVSLFNNESAAIGKRALEIDFEESGKCPNLEDALDVTLSSTEVGASNVGTIRVYGTAGTKDSNWKSFANIFYNPNKYKMMPFENVWDDNSRNKVCGFFHPQVLNLEPYMDINGNSLLELAYKKDLEDKHKQSKELDTSKYIIYVGQRANKPEEAFRRGGENIFSSIELSNHISRVLSDRSLQSYRDGMLVEEDGKYIFRTNEYLLNNNLKQFAHSYIEDVPFNHREDFFGCIREYYPPIEINGKVPSDTYYVTYDTISKDKRKDTVINKNSLISINVLSFPNNYKNIPSDILVASYAGRPEKREKADRICLMLCEYYNCKAIIETDTGDAISNFRKWGKLNKLHEDPNIILTDKQKRSQQISYGINIGQGNLAIDGLEYLRDWLYNIRSINEDGSNKYTFHYIYDLPLLKELTNFNLSGNFDRISSLRAGMFLLKAMQVKKKNDIVKRANNNSISIYEEIGLYNYKDNM